MKSLRILLVLSEAPLPFGGAAARWFYVLLKGLVDRGHRVTCLVPIGKPDEEAKCRHLFPSSSYDLRLYPYGGRRGLRAKWATLRRPYSYMFAPEMWRDLQFECRQGFDVLHLEITWTGWLGQGQDSSRTLLNLHSLYEIDMRDWPHDGLAAQGRHLLCLQAERRILRSYSHLITLSPRLREAIQSIARRASIHVVPLGLDLSLYPFIRADERPSSPVISLIGSMDWYPSFSAAVRLLTRLWPAIKKQVPQARLQIVGRNAYRTLRGFLPRPDVSVVENVPDTRPYFESTGVLLYAPENASGMKVKVMEAFAYGVPVVTTSEGVEGIPAKDGVHAGICENDPGLIERTVALLADKHRQERQRIAARQLLSQHCDPQITLDGVERCYQEMLARRERISA